MIISSLLSDFICFWKCVSQNSCLLFLIILLHFYRFNFLNLFFPVLDSSKLFKNARSVEIILLILRNRAQLFFIYAVFPLYMRFFIVLYDIPLSLWYPLPTSLRSFIPLSTISFIALYHCHWFFFLSFISYFSSHGS